MGGSTPETRNDPGTLYSRGMESTERIVARIQPEQMSWPTVNPEWDVRQVLNHMVNENLWAGELFRGRTIDEVGDRFDGDLVGDDPLSAYRESVEAARSAVQRPGTIEATCHLSSGSVPCADYARQLFLEALIHGWDLAKATKQDTTLEPSLVSAALPIAEELVVKYREAGLVAEEVSVPADADQQTKLLALFGRKV